MSPLPWKATRQMLTVPLCAWLGPGTVLPPGWGDGPDDLQRALMAWETGSLVHVPA